jgi:glycosyltransferase involved in cell wall biosynthesis
MSNNLLLSLQKAAEIAKKDIVIITAEEPKLFPAIQNKLLRKILKLLALIISHISMGWQIHQNRHRDAQIVYGFSTEVWLFAWVASLFWTKNVYLQNHHNIQQACENPLMRWLLKLYDFLNYKYVVNETTSALKDLGYSEEKISKHISLITPIIPETAKNLFPDVEIPKNKVGIVGQIRKGKQVEETIKLLLNLQDKLDFLLVVGTDDFSALEGMNLARVKLVNTAARDDYMAVIASCDVIILNYEKAKYYYRCSGVAMDAIAVRTYVICPNFPLMNHQLIYPSQVGLLYNHQTELETVLKQAFQLLPAKENPAFDQQYQARSIAKIAEFLDQVV